ncbi:hypothetical protein LA324_05320 [Corynebacterium coyleae]|uniref:hypothetical protein n=1 Tax=Corynebacterium coyleae TaxID=53374 RepID=UPI001CCEF033|nr:hypothetical protein [Corynebacterium coyleae]UBI10030.1 hypothetical protein LA324_05320 [Corynebacterium coyleae]
MHVFEMEETVIYTIALTDEEISDLRDELEMHDVPNKEVVEEAVSRGLINLLDVDNYVEETVMIGEVK